MESMYYLEVAYLLDPSYMAAGASAIYLRISICKWGKKGSQYAKDMKTLNSIVKREMSTRHESTDLLEQVSAIHPHMSLSYPLSPEFKLAIAKSHAQGEKALILKHGVTPYNDTSKATRAHHLEESKQKGYRIKIGYASANIKAKTTVYMAQARKLCLSCEILVQNFSSLFPLLNSLFNSSEYFFLFFR